MIPVATDRRQSEHWQQVLRDAIRDPQQLLARLQLAHSPLAKEIQIAPSFRVLVPESFLSRMQPGRADDPLLRQVLATRAEALEVPGFSADPLQEAASTVVPGLLHKYAGRVLLIATSACAVHCRYCFRREFPYDEHRLEGAAADAVLAYLHNDPSIHEVILSGGDPLMLKDAPLAALVRRLEEVPHLHTLRIHTRLPIVIPQRVTTHLLHTLRTLHARSEPHLRAVVVVHANHPAEIDTSVSGALAELAETGSLVLNQSVLLAGVNDQAEVLAQLSERLFAARALPYYLHLLDPVHGTAHFEVSEARGRQLIKTLRARLPGYLVPRLVREVAGAPAKSVIAS